MIMYARAWVGIPNAEHQHAEHEQGEHRRLPNLESSRVPAGARDDAYDAGTISETDRSMSKYW